MRLTLQRRAGRNLRRHVQRAAVRFLVLVVADLASFYIMRGLLRAVRDAAVLGDWLAGQLQRLAPGGLLSGWQFAAALFAALLVTGNYGPGDGRRSSRRLFLGAALATALPLWMTVWTRGVEVVAVQYLFVTTTVWLGLMAERRVLDRLVEPVLRRMRHAARTIFVGPAEECRDAARSPAFTQGRDYMPLGFLDTHIPAGPDALGHIVDFGNILVTSGAETVVVCGYLTDSRFQEVVDQALTAGCQVLSVPRAIQIAGVQPTVVWRRGRAFMELTAPSLKGQQLFVKRVMDIIGSLVGLVLLAPVFALLALVIKLDSRGPVFFTQPRVGKGGRTFRIAKFRTMVTDAEQQRDGLLGESVYSDARLFKLHRDPRITRVGRWLRNTSLDELPQMWNVLRGQMALVGPRPPLPSEVELYEAQHYARFDVKPGMTGPWQVAGRNQITDFERVVQLEVEYIQNWSLGRDLSILLQTIPVVLSRRGAV